MKVKARTTVTITKAEICEAIKLWAETKGVPVEGDIVFEIEEVYDSTDWRENPVHVDNKLTGAWFISTSQEHDA